MQEEFWQEKWRSNQIGFHEDSPHPFLVSHFERLNLSAGDTVFVPLCGKAVELEWLAARGLRVVGVEFSELAVEELFARYGVEAEKSQDGPLMRYSAGRIDVLVGDFFELTSQHLGQIDAVFDRAALVALPPETRMNYAARLNELTAKAPQILITFDYDQAQMDGPPFAVPAETIRTYYEASMTCQLLATRSIPEPLAQRCIGQEEVWLLEPIAT